MMRWNNPYSPPLSPGGPRPAKMRCPRCRHVAFVDLDGETSHGCMTCVLEDNVMVYLRLANDGELNPPTPRPAESEV